MKHENMKAHLSNINTETVYFRNNFVAKEVVYKNAIVKISVKINMALPKYAPFNAIVYVEEH